MSKPKKSQAAVEYVMTYGWAILVILIVGVMMWQLGIFKIGGQTAPGSRGFSQIRPLDWSLKKISATDGTLDMIVVNDAGVILQLPANSVFAAVDLVNCSTGPATAYTKFRPGQTIPVTLTCQNLPAEYQTGEYYRATVVINYINPASGLNHSSVGIVFGGVE